MALTKFLRVSSPAATWSLCQFASARSIPHQRFAPVLHFAALCQTNTNPPLLNVWRPFAALRLRPDFFIFSPPAGWLGLVFMRALASLRSAVQCA